MIKRIVIQYLDRHEAPALSSTGPNLIKVIDI